jgi:hypothetical protein
LSAALRGDPDHSTYQIACEISFEIASGMLILKDFVTQSIEALQPFSKKYGARDQEAERDTKAIRAALFPDSRTGELVVA